MGGKEHHHGHQQPGGTRGSQQHQIIPVTASTSTAAAIMPHPSVVVGGCSPLIVHHQLRLLYLRHASRCCTTTTTTTSSSGNGEVKKGGYHGCPESLPECSKMKELWQHITKCVDQQCKFPLCVPSRYILLHYYKCRDDQCPLCGPVREAIRNQTPLSFLLVASSLCRAAACQERQQQQPPLAQKAALPPSSSRNPNTLPPCRSFPSSGTAFSTYTPTSAPPKEEGSKSCGRVGGQARALPAEEARERAAGQAAVEGLILLKKRVLATSRLVPDEDASPASSTCSKRARRVPSCVV